VKVMRVRGQAGFTLVEAMVVVAIVAIMAAVGMPNFIRYVDNNRLRAAGRDVSSDISDTKSRAVAQNAAYRITFNVSGNSYTIESPADTVVQTKSLAGYGSGVRLQSANFGGAAFINFQTRGTTDLGTVVLRNNRTSSTVTITSNITGKAYVTYSLQ